MVSKPYACPTSMCVHGLSDVHAFAMTWGLAWPLLHILLLILDLLRCKWVTGLSSFISLLPPWAGSYLCMGLSFFNPTLTLFVGRLTLLSCRLVVFVMLLFNFCLLGLFCACCTLYTKWNPFTNSLYHLWFIIYFINHNLSRILFDFQVLINYLINWFI